MSTAQNLPLAAFSRGDAGDCAVLPLLEGRLDMPIHLVAAAVLQHAGAGKEGISYLTQSDGLRLVGPFHVPRVDAVAHLLKQGLGTLAGLVFRLEAKPANRNDNRPPLDAPLRDEGADPRGRDPQAIARHLVVPVIFVARELLQLTPLRAD